MADFICKLGTESGDVIEKNYQAVSEDYLRKDLESKGYHIFTIRATKPVTALFKSLWPFGKKISIDEFLIFNREFSALIKAGLPALSCLDILSERRKEGFFKEKMNQIRENIKAGASLSEAFSATKSFPPIYCAALSAGERSGELVPVLKRYIFYIHALRGLKKKIVSALIYPFVLVIVASVIISILMLYVIPKFQPILENVGGQKTSLPFITEIVIGISGFLSRNFIVVIILIIALIIGIRYMVGTEKGGAIIDKYKMRIPFVGIYVRKFNIANFSRTLATLLSGGVPLVTALSVTLDALSNRYFKSRISDVIKKVSEGGSLWESLESTGETSDLSIEMIKVGESTGALSDMLENVADFYDEELTASIERFVAILEPVLLIFMAVIVASIILSVYLPLITSFQAVES